MPRPDVSLRGLGRETMVPDEGLPFDVGSRFGERRDEPVDLRRLTVSELLRGVQWEGREPIVDPLAEPAYRFFARFPWEA